MRVLLVAPSSHTRLHHLVPLGWALRTAGHAVLIAARPAFTEAVTATGFVAVAVGTDAPDGSDRPEAASADLSDGARPILGAVGSSGSASHVEPRSS
ncbi:hypothetical protein AB0R12_26575, partial [Streptomyces niveus]